MADLTIPATIKIPSPPSTIRTGLLGATVGLFVPVYLDPADQTYKPGDADLSDNAARIVSVALIGGVATGYGALANDGDYDLGSAILTQGLQYYLSHTTGKICLFSDLVTGDRVVEIGRAVTTAIMRLAILNTGILIP